MSAGIAWTSQEMAARIHCGRNALQRNVQHRIINYWNGRFDNSFLINLIVMQFLGSWNIRIYIKMELLKSALQNLFGHWPEVWDGYRDTSAGAPMPSLPTTGSAGHVLPMASRQERDVTWAAITRIARCGRGIRLPAAICESAQLFPISGSATCPAARRSSRAAGDSSAAVWVAALGQDCIDVLICSLDFLLFFYFRLMQQLFT